VQNAVASVHVVTTCFKGLTTASKDYRSQFILLQ